MSQIARWRIGLAEANDVRREQSKLPAQRFHVLAKFQPSPGAWIGGMQHENVRAFADFPIVSAIFTRLNEFLLNGHVSSLLDYLPVGMLNQLSEWKQRVLAYAAFASRAWSRGITSLPNRRTLFNTNSWGIAPMRTIAMNVPKPPYSWYCAMRS